jgi:hypothetical protein
MYFPTVGYRYRFQWLANSKPCRRSTLLFGVILGMFFVGLACTPAHAQMQFFAEWTNDYVASTSIRSTGGSIAGSALFELRFPQPSSTASYDPSTQILTTTGSSYSATLLEMRIHEAAGYLPDQVGGPFDFNGSGPETNYGDPSDVGYCSITYTWDTLHGPNAILQGHNGNFTVAATVQYQLNTWIQQIGPGINTYQYTPGTPTTITQSLNFNVQNLLITPTNPANPNLIVWDPDTMQSVDLVVNTNAGYQAQQSISGWIYDTTGNPVDYVSEQSATLGDQTITLPWIPNNLAKGIYVFSYSTSVFQGTEYDRDFDKSQNLLVSSPGGSIEIVSDDGTTATYNEHYTLTDNSFVGSVGNLPASSGRIDVYDPTLNIVYTQQLAAGDLTPGDHVVSMTMPSAQYAGTYTFLVTAQDSHAADDKFGRNRYALQVNNRGQVPGAIAWAHGQLQSQAQFFFQQCQKMGYNELPPPYHDWYHDPVIADIRGPLQLRNNPLRVACFTGHGSSDGSVLALSGNRFLVSSSQSATKNSTEINGGDFLNLDTIVAPPGTPNNALPLSYMQLVVVSGCDSDQQGGDTIVQKLLNLGVKCVVVAGNHAQNRNLSDEFFGMPDLGSNVLTNGLMKQLQTKDPTTGKWLTVTEAVKRAVDYVSDKSRGNTQNGDVLGTFKATVYGDGSLIINNRK